MGEAVRHLELGACIGVARRNSHCRRRHRVRHSGIEHARRTARPRCGWAIRVAPQGRRKGVGGMLFRAAEEWARTRGCGRLDVETQNINVGACRLYTRMGCELRRVDRLAYADLPNEVQLIWTKRIA